ncbi:hypothetical protein F5Y06DRAFT_86944 [Hypoxylon sp. FL0890]|nr:hypothetical protein F5Y06DRAFT_86944 [Hypoxylon sp. FL0890]
MSSTNSTDTSLPETVSSASDSPSTSTPTTSTDPPSTTPATTSSSTPETTPSSTSTSETPTTTSTTPTSTTPTSTTPSSTTTSPTSTTPTSSTTSTTPTPTTSSDVFTTTQVSTGENGSTAFITVTSTQLNTNTPSQTVQPTSTDASGQIITTNTAGAGGQMAEPAKIAVAVVVPIVAVALLLVGGIFFWRKRKQQKEAAEERRKEVEDYSYNPNNDPTLPDMGAGGAAGAYEMKEDGSSGGYRGWGSTTLAGSTGRKASTTMSGGAAAGVAYSDATSPTRGNFSDTRSGDGLMNEGRHSPPEGEILGAMGPTANDNRGTAQVHRGPSNASSSYSAAGRSDGSGDQSGSYGAPAYLDQYGGNNPYADGAYGQQRPGELGGQPVIRDNPARRNTRIENPSHYPQQSAGISQNF